MGVTVIQETIMTLTALSTVHSLAVYVESGYCYRQPVAILADRGLGVACNLRSSV